MSFLDELQKGTNKTARTENGAVTNNSTLDENLDFFSLAGSMRGNLGEAVRLFSRAYATDRQTALRTLFYIRDVRGGLGERDVFNACYRWLIDNKPEVAENFLYMVPEYGRWDDVFKLPTKKAITLVEHQLGRDEANMAINQPVSMMAKWLPSENASSPQSKEAALAIAKLLGIKPWAYRQRIVALRKYIKLVEQKMSANEWPDIDYSKIPSQASRKHVKAFLRHDEERYRNFLGKAEKGEVKINTKTIQTYEVFDTVRNGDAQAANALWANLPDLTNGQSAIVLADVSGSMMSHIGSSKTTAMSVSVSLALYFAERQQGVFKDTFMTFTDNPQVVKVRGANLTERLANIENQNWGMSTDIEAALLAIADAGKRSPEDIPRVLYVISDMEFNAASRSNQTNYERAQDHFRALGVPMPHIVFWNVMARQTQAPATKFDDVTLVSGFSQSVFNIAVGGKSPVELMHDVVDGERYAQIVL